MTDSKNRRRSYFIKKSFQANFIIKFCLLVILACAIMGVLAYLLSENTATTSFENLRLVVKTTSDFILPTLVLSSLVAIVLVCLASVAVTLFISHRIVGPLYRLEKSVAQLGKGDFSVEIKLRKADEVKTLADSINAMAKNLKGPLSLSQDNLREMEESIAEAEEALKSRGLTETQAEDILKPLKRNADKIKQALSYFKVCLILVLSLVALPLSNVHAKEGIFFDSSEWITKESIFSTLYFRYDVNINTVNRRIDTYRVDYGLLEKPPKHGDTLEEKIAYKIDLIALKVQEILDMRPKDLHLNIRVYPDQNNLDKVYLEVFDEENRFIAFYVFTINTLFSAQDNISANVLAHEWAHCIVDHYFSVTPPTKIAEMIAQYADAHLRD